MIPSTMGRTESIKKIISLLLPPVFWLGAWQLGAFLLELGLQGRGNQLLLPYPAAVWAALVRLWGEPAFWGSALASLGRILAGMAAGTALGAGLAGVSCLSPWAGRLLAPAIRVIRATPVTSFILLVLLWTSRDVVPVVIAAMMVLPVVWDNLTQGILATDRQLLELARAYRFSPAKTVKLIYLPSLGPYFLSAVTSGMGLAWKSGVAAEVLCLPKQAIGTHIYNTKLYLEIPDLFAWTVVVVAFSLSLEWLLRLALQRRKGGVGV